MKVRLASFPFCILFLTPAEVDYQNSNSNRDSNITINEVISEGRGY